MSVNPRDDVRNANKEPGRPFAVARPDKQVGKTSGNRSERGVRGGTLRKEQRGLPMMCGIRPIGDGVSHLRTRKGVVVHSIIRASGPFVNALFTLQPLWFPAGAMLSPEVAARPGDLARRREAIQAAARQEMQSGLS
jgi:hypothetical protein